VARATGEQDRAPQAIDPRILETASELLAEGGWDGLTQERLAERAGVSRVTTWRQGITRERVIGALLDRLGNDFRETLWPVLTATGSGAERLALGLERLCDVVDRHQPLLLASDRAFHYRFREEHGAAGVNFVDPFARFLAEGVADGSLRAVEGDLGEMAEIVFNTVCWTYLHLHSAHEVPGKRARALVIDLVFRGLAAPGFGVPR
jgi:AcrR family transcriptional regulator